MFADVKGPVEIKYQVNGFPEVEDYLIFFLGLIWIRKVKKNRLHIQAYVKEMKWALILILSCALAPY